MSADNTIIIAHFPNGEYRVAEGGAAESLDDPTYADLYRVLWFKNAPVFKTIKEAEAKAIEIEAEVGFVEYGICHVTYDRDLLPISEKEAEERLREGQPCVRSRSAVLEEHEALIQRLADAEAKLEIALKLALTPTRQKLPDERKGVVRKFRVGKYKCYLRTGEYDDGRPGEVFLQVAKPEGSDDLADPQAAADAWSLVTGLCDAWATQTSLLLQYGVPLIVAVEKARGARFAPEGMTGDKVIHSASSILDFVAKFMLWKYERATYEGLYGTPTEPVMMPEGVVFVPWNREVRPGDKP